jgi:hypothetical protein
MYTQYVKQLLDISGTGNKTYSLTPISDDKVAEYTDYCCKEGWRLIGDPETFEESRKRYQLATKTKKENENKAEREKRERRKKIKQQYIEEYRKRHKSSSKPGLNISNLAKTQESEPLGYDNTLFTQVMIDVYKKSEATLYASTIRKHHQDILRICTDGAYEDYLGDLISETVTSKTDYKLAMDYFRELTMEHHKNDFNQFIKRR